MVRMFRKLLQKPKKTVTAAVTVAAAPTSSFSSSTTTTAVPLSSSSTHTVEVTRSPIPESLSESRESPLLTPPEESAASLSSTCGDGDSDDPSTTTANNNLIRTSTDRTREKRSRVRSRDGTTIQRGASAGESSNIINHSSATANSNISNTIGTGAMNTTKTVFRVIVPAGIEPGHEFQVYAGTRIVRVRCPAGSAAGQPLQITVPKTPNRTATNDFSEDGTPAETALEPPSLSPQSSIQSSSSASSSSSFSLSLPTETFATIAALSPPPTLLNSNPSPSFMSSDSAEVPQPSPQRSRSLTPPKPSPPKSTPTTQLFEVEVPLGVRPGQSFALLAGGVRVLVMCPLNAGAGQRIRFKLPLHAMTNFQQHQTSKLSSTGTDVDDSNKAAAIKLSYDKDGWARTIRVQDLKFQWVRMDNKGDVEPNLRRFSTEKSAYVRNLDFRIGKDPRFRDGVLSLVPANQAFTDSSVGDVVTYADIAEGQGKGYVDKCLWFESKCRLLEIQWNVGHMRIKVRRDFLLTDSIDAIMSLNRRDLRKQWRFEFIGEAGIDAGGLAREWFYLVTHEIFNPDMGLWKISEANQMCMQINPSSNFLEDDYLLYFRFLGRVMGKALFDRQLVAGHMVQYMYKHILGWPVTFKDIAGIDENYYKNMIELQQMDARGEDISSWKFDFTIGQDVYGKMEEIELVEGGSNIEVTNHNYREYLEAILKHKMMMDVKPQLAELLLGFYDVIPEPLLTVFDYQELELLMCGLPEINIDDWKENTEYSGDFETIGADYPTCQWFWEVVEEFSQEMKARLLQFVTGTSGVPSQGFGALQGSNGDIRKFTIKGVSVHDYLYPRSHTCFNRIDLPAYETKEEVKERLKMAVTMEATGFSLE